MLVSNMYRHSSKIHALEVILIMFINPLSSAYYLPQRYRSNLPVPSEFCQAVKMESGGHLAFPPGESSEDLGSVILKGGYLSFKPSAPGQVA